MEYILKNREVISFAVATKSVIRVKEGVLWLTSEGDSRDRLVQFGDYFEINNDGLVVMEAMADCAFDISCPNVASRQVTVRLTLTGHKQFARFTR